MTLTTMQSIAEPLQVHAGLPYTKDKESMRQIEVHPQDVVTSCSLNTQPLHPSNAILPPVGPTGELIPVCIGCNLQITESYLLKVQPDMPWHINCLKCSFCDKFLNETCNCFMRDGRVYCKQDYNRLFRPGAACAKCTIDFTTKDYVMKTESLMYHVDCFSCNVCGRKLVTGDEFAVRDGTIVCADDNDAINRQNGDKTPKERNNNTDAIGQIGTHTTKVKRIKDGKPTRVRTVLSEKQLHTLRTCYGANPRPDALMKEQLVEMTGLSPRVIRVWFQNKRCKDKKKTMLIKHLEQQEKSMNVNLNGVQMVTQSPLHHDAGLQMIDSYHHSTWKRMTPHHDVPHLDYGHTQLQEQEMNHSTYASMIGSLYGSDDSAVYVGEDDYMDNLPPDSVSSQFSAQSTSPYSSG